MIRRRKRMSILIPTASMGDIAFLLIIFFMLASNFMKTANVKVADPQSQDVEAQDPAPVTVALDEQGTLWLQGTPVSVAELTEAVRAAVGSRHDRAVYVRIHKTLPRKDYLPVIQALSEAGVRLVFVGSRAEASADVRGSHERGTQRGDT